MANTPVSAVAKKRATAAAKSKTSKVVAKPAAKSAAKSAAKTAIKPKVVTTPAAKVVAVAGKGVKSKSKKGALAKSGKSPKLKKGKLIRDSFTMPDSEYDLIAAVKKRCVAKGVAVKKSEVLRAAVISFAALSDATAIAALQALDVIKTGRKPKEQK